MRGRLYLGHTLSWQIVERERSFLCRINYSDENVFYGRYISGACNGYSITDLPAKVEILILSDSCPGKRLIIFQEINVYGYPLFTLLLISRPYYLKTH